MDMTHVSMVPPSGSSSNSDFYHNSPHPVFHLLCCFQMKLLLVKVPATFLFALFDLLTRSATDGSFNGESAFFDLVGAKNLLTDFQQVY